MKKQENVYQLLMESLNSKRKRFFVQMTNNEITPTQFEQKCKSAGLQLEQAYYDFVADNNMIMSSDEVCIDMGVYPNQN